MKQSLNNINNMPKIFAIIGATCSGKSALALQLAPLLNAFIFSLDSLSIYKEIDIASAKPSKEELSLIHHFAIDILKPNENVNARVFLNLLNESIDICKIKQKNILIVGGSSFYLKSIIQGLSALPNIDISNNPLFLDLKQKNIEYQYNFIKNIDIEYANKISKNDKYRIQKGIEIYIQTNMPPTQFFINNPPIPFPLKIKIFNIEIARHDLYNYISNRTKNMFDNGILKETESILKKYGDNIQPFKSIGLKECLMVLQDKITIKTAQSLVATHTRQLAKRQCTFNRTQFKNIINIIPPFNIKNILSNMLNN